MIKSKATVVARFDLAFLINPISGGGIGNQVYRQLPEIMASFGFHVDSWRAELTEANRLTEQTDELLRNARKVIAVGGDGTIGFVLSRVRMLERPDTEIGLIPLGTGNDLGRNLGIFRIYSQKGLLACVKRLIRAESASFDLWDVSGHHTLAAYISLGMDAAILHDFDQARRHGRIPKGALFNQLYYLKAFISHLGHSIRPGPVLEMETPQGRVQVPLGGLRSCLISNINSYAAGSKPFAACRFDDGLLDVVLFEKLWQFILVTTITRVFRSFAKPMSKHLRCYQAYSLTIRGADGVFAQLDGEDITEFLKQHGGLMLRPLRKVRLLDLRRAFFDLF